MKRVLLVTRPIAPPWDEASKNFAYNLARGIKSFKFTVLTPDINHSIDKSLVQLPLYSNAHLSTKQKVRLIKLYLHRNKFDIVHFLLTPNKLNAYTARLIFGKKRIKSVQTVVTVRDDIYSTATIKRIMFGDVLVTYSDYAKNKLERIGFKNVRRIYPGIDFGYYRPMAKDVEMCAQFGISSNDFVITYPGEYTRLGVTDELVKMLPQLFQEIPNLKFIFACRIKNNKDAKKKLSIKEHFSSLHLSDRVIYTDTVKDMAKLYNLSDIVLFPVTNMVGKFDVPLSIIEAMACSKPVVATDLPVLSEFTQSNNAVVVPHNKISMLSDEIIKLYNSPIERKRIAETARKFVTATFDIKDSRKEYEKVYRELMEQQ